MKQLNATSKTSVRVTDKIPKAFMKRRFPDLLFLPTHIVDFLLVLTELILLGVMAEVLQAKIDRKLVF